MGRDRNACHRADGLSCQRTERISSRMPAMQLVVFFLIFFEFVVADSIRVEAVVLVARHGTRGPYGLWQDNPSEEELTSFTPNGSSFAVSRESFRIQQWQALTPGGAVALRSLARSQWHRYRKQLFGEERVPSCDQLYATPDTDVRNLQSSAHFMGVFVGGGVSVLETDEQVAAASAYGMPIGRCANITRRLPPQVLRQGGSALPGLPTECGTATEKQVAERARGWLDQRSLTPRAYANP